MQEKRKEVDERERRVRLLLATADAYLPGPNPSLKSESGPAPSRRVPCVMCNRSGSVARMVSRQKVISSCPACAGSGWRRRRKGDDPWDEYLNEPIRDFESRRDHERVVTRGEQSRQLDAEIAKLQRNAALRAGVVDGERERWEIERQRLYREGSYGELRRCLALLGARSPHVWKATLIVHQGDLIACSQRTRQLADIGVAFLAQAMRGDVRVPQWVDERVRSHESRKSVEELAALGFSARRIAKTLHLSLKTVKAKLHQRDAEAMPSDACDTVGVNPPAALTGRS